MSRQSSEPAPLTAPAPRPAPEAAPSRSSPPSPDRQGKAALLMCVTAFIFAAQDAISRHLGGNYPPALVVMLRYWFFILFVLVLVARAPGGMGAALRSRRPLTQILRGVLLVVEINVIILAFVRLGLVNTHAIFACAPLIVTALSGPVLGEKVGWRRWCAIAVGFTGILIVLRPGSGVFSADALLAVASTLMFATYLLATRHVSRDDPAIVSFFWTGICGVVTATILGVRNWQPIAGPDIPWMALLCLSGALSHYLLIRCYEMAEASSLQPYSYTQLIWVIVLAVVIFGETISSNVILGGLIVVGAGLFTWWREHQLRRVSALPPQGPAR